MLQTPGGCGEKLDIKGYYTMQPRIRRDGSLWMKMHYYDDKVYLCIQAVPPPADQDSLILTVSEPDADASRGQRSCIRKKG